MRKKKLKEEIEVLKKEIATLKESRTKLEGALEESEKLRVQAEQEARENADKIIQLEGTVQSLNGKIKDLKASQKGLTTIVTTSKKATTAKAATKATTSTKKTTSKANSEK